MLLRTEDAASTTRGFFSLLMQRIKAVKTML